MKKRLERGVALRRLILLAMFIAMAYVVMLLVHIKVSVLTLDLKDAVITLCGLLLGPSAALICAIVVPLLELVTVSGTGLYGLVMNVVGSATFSVTASLIYKYQKNMRGAFMALFSGSAVMVAVMLLFNLLVTPHYFGMPVSKVVEMIPMTLLPFNLAKAAINAGMVLLLYKPLSTALKRAGVLGGHGGNAVTEKVAHPRLRVFLVALVAVLLIVASLCVTLALFQGKIIFGTSK